LGYKSDRKVDLRRPLSNWNHSIDRGITEDKSGVVPGARI